jgi:hypothetical protein
MRSIARTVGQHLRESVGYRGAFTIDGVMTVDGFRPTELNPRNGGGLNTMARGSTLPLQLLLDALVGGVDADWQPRLLEEHLLATFDGSRVGGTWRIIDRELDAVTDCPLLFAVDGDLRPAADDEPHDLTLSVGPGTHGSFARAAYEPARTVVGAATGPLAARVWAHLDRVHDLGIGPLEAARDVRA